MEKTNEAMRESLKEYATKRSVLEIGCGGGWLAEYLLKMGVKTYSGFDFSETAVKNTRSRLAAFEDAKIWRGDALNPQYYTKKYGCLVAHQFLQCLVGADRTKWLTNCRASVKSDGILLISTVIGMPNVADDPINPETKMNKSGTIYYATEEEVKAEIHAAGFEIEEILHPEENVAIFAAGPLIS